MMKHFTKDEMEQLSEDPAVARRLTEFLGMSGREFFQEVQAALSPEELEEYLMEHPEESLYLLPKKSAEHTPKKERPVK